MCDIPLETTTENEYTAKKKFRNSQSNYLGLKSNDYRCVFASSFDTARRCGPLQHFRCLSPLTHTLLNSMNSKSKSTVWSSYKFVKIRARRNSIPRYWMECFRPPGGENWNHLKTVDWNHLKTVLRSDGGKLKSWK